MTRCAESVVKHQQKKAVILYTVPDPSNVWASTGIERRSTGSKSIVLTAVD